jgi:glycosyltransferase involved in cell wall biosynthesis
VGVQEYTNDRQSIALYGFRAGAGGISHVMLNLMNALVDQGIHVELLLHRPQIPELSKVRPEIRVVRLAEADGLHRLPSLVRYLRAAKPTVVLANREAANRAAVLARRLSGVPTRIAIRVGAAISVVLKRGNFVKRWLLKQSMFYCYHRADYIIANSRGVAQDIAAIIGIPMERIHILNNPTVSPDIFQEAKEDVDHPWFLSGSYPIILGVGRLVRAKDYPTLLRAFAKLHSQRDCRLVILGEGKERQNLAALARNLKVREYVDMPGHVANPFAYMSRAAQFVLSSAWEGSPNALIEALALGLPVVATDCRSGPREILANGRYGLLVPVGDVDALAEAIIATLDNPPAANFLKSGAAPYSVAMSTSQYLTVLGLSG